MQMGNEHYGHKYFMYRDTHMEKQNWWNIVKSKEHIKTSGEPQMPDDILYANPLLWIILQHLLQKILQQPDFFLTQLHPRLFNHWTFIFRWWIVLLTYLEQLHPDGASVCFLKHAVTILLPLVLNTTFSFSFITYMLLLWLFQEHAVIPFFSYLIEHVFVFHFSFPFQHVFTFTFSYMPLPCLLHVLTSPFTCFLHEDLLYVNQLILLGNVNCGWSTVNLEKIESL